MGFDIDGARKAGYSDDQIADYLGEKKGLDVAAARKAGYTTDRLLVELSDAFVDRTPASAPAPPSAGLSSVTGRRGGTRAEAKPYVAPDPAITNDPLSKPAPADQRQPLIEQRGAPVSDEVFKATLSQLSAMPRAQRQAQARRTDLPGWMQETVRRAVEQIDGADAGAQRVGMTGPSLEARTARLQRDGADFQTATARATTDAQRDAPTTSLPQMTAGQGLLTGEEQTANRTEGLKMGRKSLAERGLYGAKEGMVQGTAGLIAMGLRAAGDEEAAKLYEKVGQGAAVRSQAANELTLMQEKARDAGILPGGPLSGAADYMDRMGTGAANSIGQMVPGIAAGLATGNAGVGLAMMALPVFGQSYIDKRDAGGSPGISAAYGGAMAALEIIGERYGMLPQALNTFRKEAAKKPLDEVPQFIERAIAAAEKRGLFTKPVAAIARGQAGEQFGEQITGAGQYLLDGTAFGLDKPISLRGFIENARDTAVQTLLATGVMQAGGAAAKGTLRGTRVAEDPNATDRPASAPLPQPIPPRVEPTMGSEAPKPDLAALRAQHNQTIIDSGRYTPEELVAAGITPPSSSPSPVENNGTAPMALSAGASPAAPEAAQNPAQADMQPAAQAVDKITGILQQAGALPQDFTGLDEAPRTDAPAPEPAPVEGEKINRNWSAFAPESGTLGIPRADMPQVSAEHRGALVQFLGARGIEHTTEEVPTDSLKPTQAEYSPRKVAQARERKGGDRSILVSQDGYVIDGHHQWLAAREDGAPVKAIVMDAPAADILRLAHQFPSSYTAPGPKRAATQEPTDGQRPDAGGTAQPGPADGAAGTGTEGVVQGELQQPAAAGTAQGTGDGAAAGGSAVPGGPGDAHDALKPGATFTLDGKRWTVDQVKTTAVGLKDAEGKTRMVARSGATFQKIKAALQPAAAPPEPAKAETHQAPQGDAPYEVTSIQQERVQTAAGALAPAAPKAVRLRDGGVVSIENIPSPSAFSNLVRAEFGAPSSFVAKNEQGEEVGRLTYMPGGGPIDSVVREQDRRRGIATALYDQFEAAGGKLPAVDSGVAISGDARAFRAARAEKAATQERPKAEKPQPTEATHADPGEKHEPVTPEIVKESLTVAAKNEDRKPSAMKADLLAQIDRAAQSAPDAAIPVWKEPTKTQLREVMVRNNLRDLERARKMMENAHHNRVDEESKRIGFITFDVPGDGVFKVLNTQAHLSEFRKKVEASQVFKAKAAREDAAAKADKAQRDAEQARLKKEAEARDDKARADQTVDDFQLGQSAEQQMSGMSDLFAESAEATAPQSVREQEDPAPITEAEARKRLEWRDLGQSDGERTHGLYFDGMGYGRVTLFKGDSRFKVDDGEAQLTLKAAKAEAERLAIERLRRDGYVEAQKDAQAVASSDLPPTTATGTGPESIQDAGEKIGGARKDLWKERGLAVSDLDAMTEAEGATVVNKANVWKPDYAAIAEKSEPVTAAMVKVVYDSLAAKPKDDTPQGRRDYVTAMQAVRKVYSEVRSAEEAKDAYRALRVELGVELRQGTGSGFIASKDAGARRAMFSVYKGRSDPFVFGYNELARARKLVQEGFPGAVEPWTRRYAVSAIGGPGITEHGVSLYAKRAAESGVELTAEQLHSGAFEVRTKDGKAVGYGATRSDAEAAAKALYERTKGSTDTKEEPDRPHLDKVNRDGLPQRIDRDVSPETLLEDFGFRGVEFGNWAAQDERRKVLALAYDALADLAEILNVPRKALSLNGTMGLAFGARGGGRFAAHYEPGKLVINMTKLRGAGSLAHEWAHALDHYLGELDRSDAYAGLARGASGWYSQDNYNGQPRKRMEQRDGKWVPVEELRMKNLRPELAAQVDAVMKRLYETPIPQAEALDIARKTLDQYRDMAATMDDPKVKAVYERGVKDAERVVADLEAGKPSDRTKRSSFAEQAQRLSGKSLTGYWVRPTEMFARSFESYVFDRLIGMGARSEYLVHGVEQDRYSDGTRYKGNPYPTGDERAAINEQFGKLFDTLKTREDDAGNVALFSRQGRNGGGIGTVDAEAIAADIRATMPSAPQIVVVEKVSQLPDRLRDLIEKAGAENDVEGVYWNGKVYAVSEHFSDLDRFRFVVAHHELRHHGFGAMLGPKLNRIMMQVYRTNAKVRELADKNLRDGIARDVVVATEEALADMAPEDLVKLNFWASLKAAVRDFLRTLAMKLERKHPTLANMLRPEAWTDEDIARLISRAEDMSRTGEPDYVRGGAVFAQAWHGTPHRGIEKFSTDKIGTGEGAQAYGWGLYFASKREIAEHYRKTLSGDGFGVVRIDGRQQLDDPEFGDLMVLEVDDRPSSTLTGAAGYTFMRDLLSGFSETPAVTLAKQWLDRAEQDGKSIEVPGRNERGQLYEVTVPEDSELLLWDKPLSAHPAAVREALDKVVDFGEIEEGDRVVAGTGEDRDEGKVLRIDGDRATVAWDSGVRTTVLVSGLRAEAVESRTGEALYLEVSGLYEGDKAASEALAAAGIKGIKYLDGTSRDGSGDSHNYVIFSGDDVRIERAMFSRKPKHDPKTTEALARAGIRPAATWREKLAATYGAALDMVRDHDELLATARQAGLDQFHGIDRAVQRDIGNLPVEQDPYIAARLANGATSAVMRALLLHGQARWTANGQHLEKVPGTKGLLDILAPLGEDVHDWFGWMIGNRAARLMKEGRENNFTPDQIAALQALATPAKKGAFQKAAMEYAAFKRSVLDVAQVAGLINPETRKSWDYADYIPFYRQTDAGADGVAAPRMGRKGLAGQSSGIRTLKGGESALNDPIENLLMNFSRLIDASLKNNAIRSAITTLSDAGSEAVHKVGYSFSAEVIPADQVRKRLVEAGTPAPVLDAIPPEVFEGMAKMWAIKQPADPDVVRVMVDGKPQFWRVNDPLLLRALTSFTPFNFPGLALMRGAKRLLTSMVTSTPDFIVRNFMRDTAATQAITRDGFSPHKALAGMVASYRETGAAEAMLFAGASFGSGQVNAADPAGTAAEVRRSLRARGMSAAGVEGFMSTLIDTPARVWEKWRDITDAVENANREAVYAAATKAGRSATAAAFESKDLMDFSLRGSAAAYQLLADVLPFFNARVQGLYRLGRADPKRLATVGAIITVASLLLAMANDGEDWYEELPDWDKDTYWHFKIGGHHFRIPKPFEVGVAFATIPERIGRRIKGLDTGSKTLDRLWANARDQLAFDPIPQLARPVLNVWANKDTFRDSPIETLRDEGKLPAQRYDARTSDTMRLAANAAAPLANATGLSPKRLEYLVNGYFGTAGSYALGLSDIVMRRLEGKPPGPSLRADDIPLVKSFYRVDPARATLYESELYKMREEVEKIHKSVKALQKDNPAESEAIAKKEQPKLALRGTIVHATKQLAALRRQADAIYADKEMPPDEKRRQLDALQVQKNQIAKQIAAMPEAKAAF